MFHDTSPHAQSRLDLILAAGLAAIAGYVNAAGWLLIGSFSSHVTGNVGRMANDLAALQLPAAAAAATMVALFFAGAFVASLALDSELYRGARNATAAMLGLEALLLAAFCLLSLLLGPSDPRAQDGLALLLCVAMGLQNGLVTRSSGAVVRSTHLTGAITDLGIEAARWFRFGRHRLSDRVKLPLSFSQTPPERPKPHKIALSAAITAGFIAGAVIGAFAVVSLRAWALLLPAGALAALALALIVLTRERPAG